MSAKTAKKTVEDIKQELVTTYDYDENYLKTIKGKSGLIELLEEEIATNTNLEEVEDIEEEHPMEKEIHYTSPDWTAYVMSKLQPDEIGDGGPTVDGLRRVTELLLGTIVKSISEVLQVPSPENQNRATVKHRLHIITFDSFELTIDGCADVYFGNTDSKFQNFAIATAETRAEGRALRRALKLKRIVADEEMGDISRDSSEENSGQITDVQIKRLDIMAKSKLDINLVKIIQKEFKDITNIKQISYLEALKLFEILSSYQATGIPENLRGYEEHWQSNLKGE